MVNIKDIKAGNATIVTLTLLNGIVPGGLGFFLLENSMFMNTDFAKTLLLCILLSCPFLLVSFFLAFIFLEGLILTPQKTTNKKGKEDTENNDLALLALTNVFNIVLWMMVGFSYWFFTDANINNIQIAKSIINDYIWGSISFFVVFCIIIIVKKLKRNK